MCNCIFCKIIQKEIKADIVSETENFIAIRDVNPQAPVHVLVIPKKHIASLNEFEKSDEYLIAEANILARKIAKSEGISESGYRLVLNTNSAAGQSVFHIHWHILGGREMTWPPG